MSDRIVGFRGRGCTRFAPGGPGTVVSAGGGGNPAPTTPNSPSPADGATNVTINPTLTFSAANGTSFQARFDPITPPVTTNNLGSVASYLPGTLGYSQIYYWQALATNDAGTTTGPIWRFTTRANPGPTNFIANHPRLLLTPAKKTELLARVVANTAEYVAYKAVADAYAGAVDTTNTTLLTPLGLSDATFTVADGSAFPTGAFSVHIGGELISIASRSGDTFTIAGRGQEATELFLGAVAGATTTATHAVGATVWKHVGNGNFIYGGHLAGLLHQLGVSGYELTGRAMLSYGFLYGSVAGEVGSYNYHRWTWPYQHLGYDWLYDVLTANEKAVYAELARVAIQTQLDDAYELLAGITRPRYLELALSNNIPLGSLQSVLMGSAATYGDNASAQAQWDAGMVKVNSYLIPSMQDGPYSGGNANEGDEYAEAVNLQAMNVLDVIASATNTDLWASVSGWLVNFAKYVFYATLPGSSASSTSTTGSGSAGSRTLTVASSSSFVAGQIVVIAIPFAPGNWETAIADVSGVTWTLADALPHTITSAAIVHASRQVGYGDQEHSNAYVNNHWFYGHDPFTAGHVDAIHHLFDKLRTTNPTYAAYLKWWIDNTGIPYDESYWKLKKFLWYDRLTTAVDYTAAGLSKGYAVNAAYSTGLLLSRSSWSPDATLAQFIVRSEMSDHTHGDQNSYNVLRKGVRLTWEWTGYSSSLGGTPQAPDGFWVGSKYHNAVEMDGHGGANGFSDTAGLGSVGNEFPLPARIQRAATTSAYAYARGEAGGQYGTTNQWTSRAQTFVRDFVHLYPDTIVFHDRLVYTSAFVSPTKWCAQFREDPTIAGQRITLSMGGQKIVQDIVLPTGATLTKVDQLAENSLLAGFRVETVSGANTTTEYSLQVLQLMDSGTSPASVSTLTTTNANVVQIGASGPVVGFVKGASVTLNISYSFTGSPTHTLFGFDPNTAYHVVSAGGGVTISVATGFGDTVASSQGVLTF